MNKNYFHIEPANYKLLVSKVISILFALLLFNFPVYSQDVTIDSITQPFNRYNTKAFQEKIYLHIDKTFYVAGETIWFKLYNTDGYFNKPLQLEKVAYIEIIDKDGRPVLQTRAALKHGSGSGSFSVPLSLNSGTFKIRAYTSWMKNFSADYFFEQAITIVNTLKKPKWRELEVPSQYRVQFFPEGGNLVTNLQSKVGFKVTDQYGKGFNCKGIIINQAKDTIASFRSLRFGMGHFLFTPLKGAVYKAIIRLENNEVITQTLPAAYEEGYVMQVKNQDSNFLNVEVTSSHKNRNAPVYLIAQTRLRIKAAQVKMLQDGKIHFLLDRATLGEGISQVTLFDNTRNPLCERLYFKKPASALNIAIQADNESYGTRKKVTLNVSAYNTTHQPVAADMSLSVFLLDSLQTLPHSDIQTYLWLTSDIKGIIEDPDYYVKNSDAEALEVTDNLMLTQGWRRFMWGDVLHDTTPAFNFLPEYEGPVISGTVTDKRSGLPAADITAYLSAPGIPFEFSNAVSAANGAIQFITKERNSNNEIIVQTDNKRDSAYRIDIVKPYAENFTTVPVTQFMLPEQWKEQLALHSINAQAQHIYEPKGPLLLPMLTDSLLFYGKPDKTYYLDDYTRFITMEEVMREYVAEVRVRKQNNQFSYLVKNIPYGSYFDNNPLILLDGVPVFDVNQMLLFDPLKIKKIDVVARKYYSGTKTYDGIVSYATYGGDLGGFELNPNALIMEYAQPAGREFYAPQYGTTAQQNSRLPDYRTQLYWAPFVTATKQGKQQLSFYTSDLPGRYAIVAEGLTTEGLAGSYIITFKVRR